MQSLVARSLFVAVFFTLVSLLTVSCGGGGGGTVSVTPAGTGSVGILLTDKPTSLELFSGVMMTVAKVELFAEDGGKVTVYEGRPRGPFNLLRLRNESRPLTFHDQVPSGWYCKIRLTLDDMWLTFKDGRPDYHPKLPGNRKLDLNAKHCFHVDRDSTHYIQLDMDMSQSIHIVRKGHKDEYNVRPVVFIEEVHSSFRGRLVRLEAGTIEELDRVDNSFLLCDALPVYGDTIRDRRDACVKVRIGNDTSAFDNDTNDGNATEGGDAIPLEQIYAAERVGRGPVTVVGYFRNNDEDGHPYVAFDALVVELGQFLNLDGEATSAASDGRFNMDVLPGQEYTSDDPLPVVLQPAPIGGNGTKILSRDGKALNSDDIQAGLAVTVDGVLTGASSVYLNSALVIVDTDALSKDIASGVIDRVSAGSLLLEADSFVCEPGTGPGFYRVSFGDGTDIYEITETRDAFDGDFVASDSLEVGQTVDISGECVDNELFADTIVIHPQN